MTTRDEDLKRATQTLREYVRSLSNDDYSQEAIEFAKVMKDAGWGLKDSAAMYFGMTEVIEEKDKEIRDRKWEVLTWRIAVAITLTLEVVALFVR